jgi:uncharacterized protein (TIGR03437 family)
MHKHHLLLVLGLTAAAGMFAQVRVVNGASFRDEQPLTPGSWATAFAALPGATTAVVDTPPHPTTLGGVRVLVDGIEARLYYVDQNQINFLVPSGVAAGIRPVRIISGATEMSVSVRVMTAAPGIFVIDRTVAPPLGAIRNQDFTVNSASNAARRGEVIQIYATGPGALSQPIGDGEAAPSLPLVTTVSTPQVYVGGVPARLQFSGMAPSFAGLWQVNVFLPEESFINGQVPVRIFMDGVDSNEVSVFVSQ